MKKLILFLMIIMSVNILSEEILKKEEKINMENTNYIPEPPITVQNNFEFSTCLYIDGKCIFRGFKVDGEEMNEVEREDLKYNVHILNKYVEKGSIEIIGYTDSTGSKKHNLKLSLIRAKNAAKLLREYGLDKRFSIVKIMGKGEEVPSDTNETVEGRYYNRRVEIIFNNMEYKKSSIFK